MSFDSNWAHGSGKEINNVKKIQVNGRRTKVTKNVKLNYQLR